MSYSSNLKTVFVPKKLRYARARRPAASPKLSARLKALRKIPQRGPLFQRLPMDTGKRLKT